MYYVCTCTVQLFFPSSPMSDGPIHVIKYSNSIQEINWLYSLFASGIPGVSTRSLDRTKLIVYTTHCIIDQCDRCHLYYTRGRRRQQMFIFSTSAATPATRQQRHCYHSIHRSSTEKCSARCLIWWVMVI